MGINKNVSEFGVWLRAIRAIRNISQRELSRSSCIPEAYISRFESGTMIPSESQIYALEKAFGSSFDDKTIRTAFESLKTNET